MRGTHYTPKPRPDLDAIKQLDAFDAAQRWGIIHQGTKVKQAGHWAFDFEGTYPALTFKNGGFYYHKDGGHGGSVIDLVILYLGGGSFDKGKTGEALEWIAAREGLYVNHAPQAARSKSLAVAGVPTTTKGAGASERSGALDAAAAWIGRAIKSLGGGGDLTEQAGESRVFFAALGLEWGAWTLAPQTLGDAACLCWVPGVPWQGVRIFPAHANGVHHGWTRERALEWWGKGDAGRVFVLDFDGVKGGLKPSVALLLQVLDRMKRRGMGARCAVTTTWEEGAQRAKCHVYFVAKERAKTEAEFVAWHQLLDAQVDMELGRLGVEEGSAEWASLGRDKATHQITRLVRVPGWSKSGGGYAATLLQTWEGAVVDFRAAAETRDTVVDRGSAKWFWGRICYKEVWKKEGAGEEAVEVIKSATPIADECWPLAVTSDAEGGGRGVLYRYTGGRYGLLPAGSWVDKSLAKSAAGEAGGAGVKIHPGAGVEWVMGLGTWATHAKGAPEVTTVRRGGWHGEAVFVQGELVHGAPWRWAGPQGVGAVRGDLGAWREQVAALVGGSPLMALLLGAAFASPLIERLGQGSFLLHVYGASSGGKSIATRVAGTVWGDPRKFLSWKDTGNFLLGSFPARSGQALVLDDLRKARSVQDVAELVLALSDNATRGRADRRGAPRERQSFSVGLLSSGEQSVASFLGEEAAQGGHTVRAIDVRIGAGEATRDLAHAKEIEAWEMSAPFGVAGAAWAAWLVEHLNVDDVRARVEDLLSGQRLDPENGRIAWTLALCAAALEFALLAGVAPRLGPTAEEIVRWAVVRVCEDRGAATSPEARAARALLEEVERERASYPTARSYADDPPSRGIGGIYDPPNDFLWVTEGLIKPLCGRLKVQPRAWLAWLASHGYATPPTEVTRLEGLEALRGRWHRVNMAMMRGQI